MQCTEVGVAIALRRRVERTDTLPERKELPEIGIDCGFFGRDKAATDVDRKGASDYASSFLTAFIKSLGFRRILVKSDSERSLLGFIECVSNNLLGVELVLMSPEGDQAANGFAEVGGREIIAQTRILESAGAAIWKSDR